MTPTANDIYDFAFRIFCKARLTPECSIVCLIYIERLMFECDVFLLSRNWRPILICGLLLASKVWQDIGALNREFSNAFPEFSLHSISWMEQEFVRLLKFDLCISASVYAKYYFALRSLPEKRNFRRRYVNMFSQYAPGQHAIEQKSMNLESLYSKSM